MHIAHMARACARHWRVSAWSGWTFVVLHWGASTTCYGPIAGRTTDLSLKIIAVDYHTKTLHAAWVETWAGFRPYMQQEHMWNISISL